MATTQLINISELFYSIQGESTHAGLPCVFLRMAGCNLRCSYCDASYTYNEDPLSKSIDELITYAERFPHAMVEITGGEPLLQEAVYSLMQKLLDNGRTVLLETNGSISLAKVPKEVIKIVDVKCPGSGMHSHMDINNLQQLGPDDELKFVLTSKEDYHWSVDFLREHDVPEIRAIHFSPATASLSPADLAAWILADQLPVRLQLQLHKIIWPDMDRAV